MSSSSTATTSTTPPPSLSSKYASAHSTPAGAGDARPTARQIIEDEKLLNALEGKIALVTGCSSGIGVETARALHATGADVYMTVRDVAKGKAVLADILASNPTSKGKLELVEMELGDLSSVRAGAADLLTRTGGRLHLLVNNAGVMACPYALTADGFEQQFGICHLAHFLLFDELKEALLSSATAAYPSRVVSVASMAHRYGSVRLDDPNFKVEGSYEPWRAYGQAKTANIWLANEIERRYASQHLHATSLMPGGILTPLQRHLPAELVNSWKESDFVSFLKSPEQGAATTVWAAVSQEWSQQGGKYLEDLAVAPPHDTNDPRRFAPGYATWAYDQEGAKKLWELSTQLVNTAKKAQK